MNDTMISIGKYIVSHKSAFGLSSDTDLIVIEKTKTSLVDGGKWLIMLPLRTVPDYTRGVPFGNMLSGGVKGERLLTQVEFECKTRAPDTGKDFYWNTARQFRDKVYDALAGSGRCGIKIPRYNWTDIENPVAAGEIWFEVNPKLNSPMEDPLEDANDSANKSIFLTYSVHWWKPVT